LAHYHSLVGSITVHGCHCIGLGYNNWVELAGSAGLSGCWVAGHWAHCWVVVNNRSGWPIAGQGLSASAGLAGSLVTANGFTVTGCHNVGWLPAWLNTGSLPNNNNCHCQ